MTQTLVAIRGGLKGAAEIATRNWESNSGALGGSQPEVVEIARGVVDEMKWVLGRDGAVTGTVGGKWWGECSLPGRAARYMFKALEIRGVVGCFLFPVHGAQIRAALDRLGQHQAVLALVPDARTLRVILSCADFAEDIRANRLWFAAGAGWEAELRRLFVERKGLPTPADFIRAIAVDQNEADALIGPAQKIFADETTRRGQRVQEILAEVKSATGKVCVIAPSQFRMWNDAPITLAKALVGSGRVDCAMFDSDDPASASPLALAESAAGARAVITANLGRGDLPAVIGKETAVVTWVTLPRIPGRDPAAERDGLIVADPGWVERAVAAGWKRERVAVGTWPAVKLERAGNGTGAVLIADTMAIEAPKSVSEFSSHLMLWDAIAAEISRDYSVVGSDVEEFLTSRMRRMKVDASGLDKGVFIEGLILPGYQQAVARALIGEKVGIQLFGKGWGEIEEFAAYAGGEVGSREKFERIVAGAGAVVHAWPVGYLHPVEAVGVPVIRPEARGRRRLDRFGGWGRHGEVWDLN